MRKLIDKILKKEEEGRFCKSCDTYVTDVEKGYCPECGYNFNTKLSTPEDGMK